MKKFEFSSKDIEPTFMFSAQKFYDIYKDSEFLKNNSNVETLLSKSYEIRNTLKEVNPGERVPIGMMIERNTPLLVVKTGSFMSIENFEFSYKRLIGLVAAFAFDNRQIFPKLSSTEAQVLGLAWDNQDEMKCRLFLSAIQGTHLFYNHFKFWPLVCVLRKYQLNRVRKENVVEVAQVLLPNGINMAEDMMNNFEVVKEIWSSYLGSSCDDLKNLLDKCPPEIKFFVENKPSPF